MAYDEKLAERVRRLLHRKPAYSERQMFGGIAFMLRGNMCCGVHGEELIVRVASNEYPTALTRPHARAFDLMGKPMKEFVLVRPRGCAPGNRLREWVEVGARAVATKPLKPQARQRTGSRIRRRPKRRNVEN